MSSHRRSHSTHRGDSRDDCDQEEHRRKITKRQCEACSHYALEHKRLCSDCLSNAAGPSTSDQISHLMNWMQTSFVDSMASAISKGTEKAVKTVTQRSRDSLTDVYSDKGSESNFDLEKVEPLILALRKILELDSEDGSSTNHDKMFKYRKKANHLLPIHKVIKEEIKTEWEQPDQKFFVTKKMNKMYPFDTEETKDWEEPPKVDAAITRVARKTTLPVDEGISLRDVMERKQDNTLKKATVAGSICKPAVAITSVARAMKLWLHNLEDALTNRVSRDQILEDLQIVKLATDYIAEASLDAIRCSAKNMGVSCYLGLNSTTSFPKPQLGKAHFSPKTEEGKEISGTPGINNRSRKPNLIDQAKEITISHHGRNPIPFVLSKEKTKITKKQA
ncbi:unnamed protein product [Protopolystoma xenopodis]|uniref:Lamina-associated polypeptide 2 alpha C-terminal domain-containing protein n=1 Tax=Protopolystoma xenopodis TaxID=117903 RepID=A0A448WJ74_9PLAT|nr:unnamed protein product [Protopolystoma xenopodis]